MKALSSELGVGTQCGSCAGCAKECLANAHQAETKRPTNVFHIGKKNAA